MAKWCEHLNGWKGFEGYWDMNTLAWLRSEEWGGRELEIWQRNTLDWIAVLLKEEHFYLHVGLLSPNPNAAGKIWSWWQRRLFYTRRVDVGDIALIILLVKRPKWAFITPSKEIANAALLSRFLIVKYQLPGRSWMTLYSERNQHSGSKGSFRGERTEWKKKAVDDVLFAAGVYSSS